MIDTSTHLSIAMLFYSEVGFPTMHPLVGRPLATGACTTRNYICLSVIVSHVLYFPPIARTALQL